ncbi:PSH1 [Candida jiufengensis]|uniref:PSH1 n=1 Tax=Candida jiufengensis TaxID=497108 RepID=UPI0022255F65|nr:PSH1 [Candida jiufengensis]KAI5953478.1 PSH1 [Candida jiufengensis]
MESSLQNDLQNGLTWNKVDSSLTSNLLLKITNSLECSICSEVMIAPMTVECGHTFCYECLHQWFKNKINCPTCRHKIQLKPVLNLQLDEICKNIGELIIDLNLDSNIESFKKRKIEGYLAYESHLKQKRIFGEIFTNCTFTMLDNSDGVPRCGNCNWEAHGSVCLHCGSRFRTPNSDDEEDEEDDEFYEDVRGIEEVADNYDSDDSFIDSRTAEEIWLEMNDNGDEDEESITESDIINAASATSRRRIWTSDNEDEDEDEHSDWEGFDSARNSNSRPHIIYVSDTDEELQVYSNSDQEREDDDSFARLQLEEDSGTESHDLIDALAEFHDENLENLEDDGFNSSDQEIYDENDYFDNNDDDDNEENSIYE